MSAMALQSSTIVSRVLAAPPDRRPQDLDIKNTLQHLCRHKLADQNRDVIQVVRGVPNAFHILKSLFLSLSHKEVPGNHRHHFFQGKHVPAHRPTHRGRGPGSPRLVRSPGFGRDLVSNALERSAQIFLHIMPPVGLHGFLGEELGSYGRC